MLLQRAAPIIFFWGPPVDAPGLCSLARAHPQKKKNALEIALVNGVLNCKFSISQKKLKKGGRSTTSVTTALTFVGD